MSRSLKTSAFLLSFFLIIPTACVEVPRPQVQIIPKPLPGYCNTQKWCWEHPTPHGNALFDVFGTSETNVWAVGAGGTLLHYDGSSWSPDPQSGLFPNLYGVYGFRSDDLWVVGDYGTLLHYDGKSWKEDPSFKMLIQKHTNLRRIPPLYSLWGANSSDLWIGGEFSILAHYDGVKWALVGDLGSTMYPNYHIRKIWGHRTDHLWAVTVTPETGDFPKSQIFYYDGTRWTRSATSERSVGSLWGPSENDIWALSDKDVLHFDGTAWSSAGTLNPPLPGLRERQFFSLGGTKETNLWVSGSSYVKPQVYESWFWHFDGKTWSQTPYATLARDFYRQARAMWGAGSSLWSVGDTGTLMHYQDGIWKLDPQSGRGVLWFENPGVGREFIRYLVNRVNLRSLWIGSPTNIWAGGYHEGVLHYNGTTWKQFYLTRLTYQFSAVTGIWGFGEDDVWLISQENGEIFHYDGQEIKKVHQETEGKPLKLFDIWGANPNEIWVAASLGRLLHYDGTSWQIFKIPTNPDPDSDMVSLFGTDRASLWAINQVGTLFHYHGTQWEFVAKDPGIAQGKGASWYSDLSGTGPNDLWAVGSKRWLIGPVGSPPNAAGFLHYDGSTWSEVPEQFYSDLTSVWGRTPQDLWISTRDGETYHYDGIDWQLIQTGVGKWNEMDEVLSKIRGLPDGQIWAVGGHGAILHYKP